MADNFTPAQLVAMVDGYGSGRWPKLYASGTDEHAIAMIEVADGYRATGTLDDVALALDALEASLP
jgi:hypothetical protein